MLKLPAYEYLSKEQDAIYHLSLNESYLVIGPPGAGKTIMAIYRAAMFKEQNRHSNFLLYNRPLRQYIEQATREKGVSGNATTFHRWFYNWYRENFRHDPPEKEDQEYVFDWDAVHKEINSSQKKFAQYDHLIIDEGQDFPEKFYVVMHLIAKHITVFADENQRITGEHSNINGIQNNLLPDAIHWLTKNYRNTLPIAEFARNFYAGLPSGIPQLPTRNGPKPLALRAGNLDEQIRYIARYERNNADKDIAIFVHKGEQQEKINELLKKHGTENKVQVYMSRKKEYKKLGFDQRGIKILAYASAKGLEFDTVFLPDLDKQRYDPTRDTDKMLFYVLTSRARQELFLLFKGREFPPLLRRIPADLFNLEDIL